MKDFPMFGICPVCGSDSGDYPVSALTSADSQSNIDESQNGVPLVWYQGKKMCEFCKKRLIADSESLLSAKKHAREEAKRSRMGFGGIT